MFYSVFIKWTQKLHFLCVSDTSKHTHTWNKQGDMQALFDQSSRKQTPMQNPCNWVCADQTVSNHQRANNKLLFSEGQQSQQHHQLDSRVCVFFLSIDRELSESGSALSPSIPSNSAFYIIVKMMDKGFLVVFQKSWIVKGLNYKCCHLDGWNLCLILFRFICFYYLKILLTLFRALLVNLRVAHLWYGFPVTIWIVYILPLLMRPHR